MKIRLSKEAKDLIKVFPPEIKKGIRATIESLLEKNHSGKALRDDLKNYFSIQFGNYRVIYSFEKQEIIIQYVGHRSSVYRDFSQQLLQ